MDAHATPRTFATMVRAGLAALATSALLAGCGGGDTPTTQTADSQAAQLQAGTTGGAQDEATASRLNLPWWCRIHACGPVRLRIDGSQLSGPNGAPLRLRGVNVEGVTKQDVDTIADQFHMNMIRLRISFIPENRAASESGFTDAYLAQIDSWVNFIRARKLWMVLEMRANDNVANSPDFYDTTKTGPCDKPTTCANFGYYLKAWKYLAARYKSTDYIAGYGLLAEPSTDKLQVPDQHLVLLNFQKTLMNEITAIDARTPFFVGPSYNYDTMEYANDAYYDELAPYHGRLVYEVNFLTPKEWIQNGTWTVNASKPAYPFADPADGYDSLLQGAKPGDSMEKTFNKRRVEDGNYQKTLSKGMIAWYLQWPLQFRERHQVPLYVDQFGAATEAIGQLAYEDDLIRFFEAHDLHWTRWSYNAAGPESQGRTLLPPNDAAIRYYTTLGAGW